MPGSNQWTSQYGDALDAFRDIIAALTFPTSGAAVFTNIEFITDAPLGPDSYPMALISVTGSTPDDDNDYSRHLVNIEVEVRQAIHSRDSGEGQILGALRTSDENVGAGLADIVEVLTKGTEYLTTSDNAEIKDYIALERVGRFESSGTYASVRVFYTGLLQIV